MLLSMSIDGRSHSFSPLLTSDDHKVSWMRAGLDFHCARDVRDVSFFQFEEREREGEK